jgi:hypothetical protein
MLIQILLTISLLQPIALARRLQSGSVSGQVQGTTRGATMHHAAGTFEVKIKPEGLSEVAADSKLGRMSIDKTFHGALEGTSIGEMLSAMGEVKGSAGYVALEKVTGTLDGKKGTFYLQHTGTMDRGVPQLSVSVVPDSGTGELAGLFGSMTINIEGGKHSYDFSYAIAAR